MTLNDLPSLNATLNGISMILLTAGYISIRRGKRNAHKGLMITAFVVSLAFLISYVIYHSNAGSTPYLHQDWTRIVYFAILIPHIILAAAMGPFILLVVWRAYKQSFEKHKKLARIIFPVWLYVSISGVIIYLMLYHL